MPQCNILGLLHAGWKHGPGMHVTLLPLGGECVRAALFPPLRRDKGTGGMDVGRTEQSLNPSWIDLTLVAKWLSGFEQVA